MTTGRLAALTSSCALLLLLAVAGLPRLPAERPSSEGREERAGRTPDRGLPRGWTSEARSCKPSAPIELVLLGIEEAGDGSVILEWRMQAHAALADARWELRWPAAARLVEGTVEGTLASGEVRHVQVQLDLSDATDAPDTFALVVEARLPDADHELVVAGQSIHRPAPGTTRPSSRPARLRTAPAVAPSAHRPGH